MSKSKLPYGIAVVVILSASLTAYSLFYSSNVSSGNQSGRPKAAIVDQLDLNPYTKNETFRQKSTMILEEAGFNVKYYDGQQVTVNFYRNLPSPDNNFRLIILRVHSGVISGTQDPLVGLFTSEIYTGKNKYPADEVASANLTEWADDPNQYYGITPGFVKDSMRGAFKDTVIIMMGCDGLKYQSMAEAFVQKGAAVYISWIGTVEQSYTDHATTLLLQSLLQQNKKILNAVSEIRPDPHWNSGLSYYPGSAGSYVIKDLISELKMQVTRQGHSFLSTLKASRRESFP